MKHMVSGIVCSVLLLLPSLLPQAPSQLKGSESPRLKLYVGEVKGDQDLVKSVRDHLVDELAKIGVALVASQEVADILLTGVGVHRTSTHFAVRDRSTVLMAIRGEIQLYARDGRKLWATDVSSAHWAASETRSFAEIAAGRIARWLRQTNPQLARGPAETRTASTDEMRNLP